MCQIITTTTAKENIVDYHMKSGNKTVIEQLVLKVNIVDAGEKGR